MTMPVGRHRKQQRLAINYTQHQDGAGYTRISLKSLNRPSVLVRCICETLTQALENKSIVKFDFHFESTYVRTYWREFKIQNGYVLSLYIIRMKTTQDQKRTARN